MSIPTIPKTLIDKELLVAFCKATADTLRLDILRVLSQESFGVLELCHIFNTPQSGMSHHLKILANAGLVSTRREGNSIFYRRALIATENLLADLTEQLFTTIDRLPLTDVVHLRTLDIHAERSERSKDFFNKHVDRLKENQDLIVDYSHYSGCLSDLINNTHLPAETRVLEVGPGECLLLDNLANQFTTVVAIDNSSAMLDKARRTLSTKNSTRVEFRHEDIQQLVMSHQQFDLIVLNMVLHHIPSPATFFHQARQTLARGGMLLIADLCSHDQDWARDVCGDLWLGFDPADLDSWAADANLTKGQSAFLGLKNGFQVQIRLFHQP